VERKREAPAVVAPIVSSFRRLCRSSRPLCFGGVLAFSLGHLAMPAVQPVPVAGEPEKPAAAEVSPSPAPLERGPGGEVSRASAAAVTAADLLTEVNVALGAPRSPYGQLIYDVAIRHSVNPQLVAAMIHVESAFNPRAVSRKGACGLMQLLPETARRFGLRKRKDLFDPRKNLEAGVRYLKWLTRRFSGDVHKILAAYNAGEGAVERFGGIPPYRETQRYVQKVFGLLGFTVEPQAQAASAGGVVGAGK
jgi:soluble lytic murein transglycosylase-like protein